jgi:hypothetical protein
VGTYGSRLLKDLECGAKYVKVCIKNLQFNFMEKHRSEQLHCKQTQLKREM